MKKRGFTLVEITITVAIIAVCAAIAIPNLLRARITANQACAQQSLKVVASAMEQWRTTNFSYNGATLAVLGAAFPPYIDSALAAGRRNGYDFSLTILGDNQRYYFVARPTTPNITGVSIYCVKEDGMIRLGIVAALDAEACGDIEHQIQSG